jgi:hypothetical protein
LENKKSSFVVSSFKCQSLSLKSTLFEIQGKGRRRGKVRKKEIELRERQEEKVTKKRGERYKEIYCKKE